MMKIYLGDGAYVVYDGLGYTLTAENGVEVTDTVYLEPEVCDAFIKFVEQTRAPNNSRRA